MIQHNNYKVINELLSHNKKEIIANWVDAISVHSSNKRERELSDCTALIEKIHDCIQSDRTDVVKSVPFKTLKKELASFASFRAICNFTPTQTANYLLALKKIVYGLISSDFPDVLPSEFINFNNLIDEIAVLTFQMYSDAREDVIRSQAHALEHDTPIVKISSDTLLMPIMGIVDTIRAQKIIESLLDAVVEHQASIAILDMTGVPTFDTHVANNLLKTITAAKMVGTQAVISGISPSVAITIVKLGLDLSHVETFNTLENAIKYSNQKSKVPKKGGY
ncbi:MAG: STAS domain-containing protein [Colwellia sp.]|nr:STAS domain-containing protein [Colwellia sp.]